MATANPPLTRRADPAAAPSGTTRTEKGISLARGPALILGTILLAAGLYFLYRAHSFPRWANFPNGTAHKDGNVFFGIFGVNGWTGEFTAVCGGLLLFGAAHHVLAKTMSLIVGCALGAAAIIAVISGNVLGMAATNGWTELGWGICAAILLFNAMIPRRTRTVEAVPAYAGDGAAAGGMTARERRREHRHEAEAGLVGAGAGVAGERMHERHAERRAERHEMANERDGMVDDRPVAGDRMAGDRMTGDRMAEDRTMAHGGTTGAVAGAGAGMAGERMAEDRTMTHDGMANDGVAGNGMAADETQMLEDRPRRFERSGTMDGDPVDENAGTTGHRRSGGLAGLFRRD